MEARERFSRSTHLARPEAAEALRTRGITGYTLQTAPAAALSTARRPLTPRRRRQRRKRGGGPGQPGRGRERHGGGGGRGAPRRAVLARKGPKRGQGPVSRECLWAGVRAGLRGRDRSPEDSSGPESWKDKSWARSEGTRVERDGERNGSPCP